MAAVSETIVREYFELHGFLLRQYRKHVAPAGREDDEIDFLGINPAPQEHSQGLPFVLGSADLALVEPALPQEAKARDESIAILRSKGIDAVISFRTMLAELVNQVEPNRNYQKSDVLQLIRILKNYGFFKEPQLELFRTKQKGDKKAKGTPALPAS